MTARSLLIWSSWVWTSSPLMPGMQTSSRTHPVLNVLAAARNASGRSNVTGSKFAELSKRFSDRSTASSSSRTETVRSVAICRSAGRKSKAKNGSTPGIRLRRQLAAVRLDYRTRNPQSQPHAVVFARDEWLKQAAGNIAGNSRPNVRDGDLDHVVIESPRRQGHLPRFLIGHRLERISDQVDDHLLDLNAVPQYNPGAVIEFKPQTDLLRSDATHYEGTGFLDQRSKRLRSLFRLAPADQLAEAADYFAGPQRLPGGLVGDFLRDQGIGRPPAGKQPLGRID